jgi:hypothetical protein
MEGRATFEQYYGEIAKAAEVRVPDWLLEMAQKSKDEHLNDIGLVIWDNAAIPFYDRIRAALHERGDGWSLAGGVCVMKTVARLALGKSNDL